jgi:hypothetical protein
MPVVRLKAFTSRPALLVIVLTCVLGLAGCQGAKPAAPPDRVAGTMALPAVDFLNSIGVNSAVSTRGEALEKTMAACRYVGIRWIRSGYEGGVPMADLLALHRQTGVRFSYGLLSGGADIPRLVKGGRELAAAGALLALEGANEPNNWAITYQGQRGGAQMSWLPVAQLQRDLYRAVKSDPVLKAFPVWSLSENGAATDNVGLQYLEIPRGAGTLMPDGTRYADYANCHNYIMHPSHPGLYDNQTWNAADPGPACKVDGLIQNYGSTWRKHFLGYAEKDLARLPRVTTETGAKLEGPLTEEKQACLFLNLYLAQFKRGWQYTALYLLRDRTDEAGNQQYGFYKPDYSPRRSAVYLHYLTTILADEVPAPRPVRLPYTIPGQPETVHDLLLQKGNGTLELVVWGEKVTGTDRVQVNLGRTFARVLVYDPTLGTAPVQSLQKVSSVSLTLGDHPLVIEILRD